MRSTLIVWLLILFCSCAKKPSQQVDEAIDQALTYLTDDKCDHAIQTLEAVGPAPTNAIYLEVLASAYACRAGYNEIQFIGSDITKVDSTKLLTSLTQLSLSPETHANSESYKDLRTALNILLQTDANQPSQVSRTAKFGTRKAGDMGIQTLFLTLTQLGKFVHFYGNVNAAGVKGGGAINVDEQTSTASSCFILYTYSQATTFLAANGGTCNDMNTDLGHPDLSLSVAELTLTKKRMCEGLMLVTNIIDILSNMTLPSSASLASLTQVSTSVTAIKGGIVAVNPALGTLISTTSQSTCESLVSTNVEFDNLQLIFALLFEKGLP